MDEQISPSDSLEDEIDGKDLRGPSGPDAGSASVLALDVSVAGSPASNFQDDL